MDFKNIQKAERLAFKLDHLQQGISQLQRTRPENLAVKDSTLSGLITGHNYVQFGEQVKKLVIKQFKAEELRTVELLKELGVTFDGAGVKD